MKHAPQEFFTKSLCPSAPVDWCKENLQYGFGGALLCNAGNANALTGAKGEQIVEESATVLSETLSISKDHIYLASTGVIGEALNPLNLRVILIKWQIVSKRPVEQHRGKKAAEAIATTDTFPKGSSAEIKGTDAVVVGIAKGSGMIAPDMATMLALFFTDIKISHDDLQKVVEETASNSFNCITVDSDTSTSDSVLVLQPVNLNTHGIKTPKRLQQLSNLYLKIWRTKLSEMAKGLQSSLR